MATDTPSPAPPSGVPESPLRVLLPQILPALVIGVAASLLYIGISELSDQLKDVVWEALPDALGIGGYSSLWMIVVLTVTGVAVGLVVWKVPGHAGPDSASTGLEGPPLAPAIVPGLLVASTLALAGGVSLGPENPIIAANVALAYWIGRKVAPTAPGALWVMLATSATIGALFGTPVASALVVSEALTHRPGDRGSLWDRLFAPLIAAGAGAMTTLLLTDFTFDLSLPQVTDPGWDDLLAAMAVAAAAAVFGLLSCYAFPYIHGAFRRLRHPMLMLPLGGLVLGLLGALGGPLTLFKGLEQIKDLASNIGGWSSGDLAKMTVIKLVALVIAASCGFRGGRIFPAVFVGVAFGMFAQALVPEIPPAVAVSAGVLGVLLATTRQGWLSLFTAAVLAPQPALLPLLCVASLFAWLIVTGRPQLELVESGASRH
ncbi:ion channel protein [Streptomyces avidinii]|uniref:ion channel protein n=1 Tax=Streptomyces avidinii TaxID=1895 RepID=UPI003866ABCE|nr:ion channel protein [Streptomyces avidinii]